MNIKFLLVLFLALPMFASCDKANDAATKGAETMKGMDISDMSVDGARAKATEMFGKLTTGLSEINAENAMDKIKSLTPTVDSLSKLKDKFAGAMPDMSKLGGMVDGLKAKFAGNEGIIKVLDPFITKLKSLMA